MEQADSNDKETINSNKHTDSITNRINWLLTEEWETGDIILFNRRCMSMSLSGALVCASAKFVNDTRWDHVGVIIKNPSVRLSPENSPSGLYVLEAGFTGVKLRPLEDRIRQSQSHEIALRKLVLKRTEQTAQISDQFIRDISSVPYDYNFRRLMNASVTTGTQKMHQDLHHTLLEKTAALTEIQRELQEQNLTKFHRRILMQERNLLETEITQTENQLHTARKSIFENSPDLSAVFCSALVAALYQRLGILPEYPPATSFIPNMFSTDIDTTTSLAIWTRKQKLKLLKGAFLQPEMYVKSHSKSIEGVPAIMLRPQDSEILRRALKRSPLSTLSSNGDLYEWLLKAFERRAVPSGESLTVQGMKASSHAHSMFVVESGKLQVLVRSRVLPSKTLTKTRSNASDISSSDEMHWIRVGSIGPGNIFNVRSFLFAEPNDVTVMATEPVVLWELHPSKLSFKADNHSPPTSVSELRELYVTPHRAEDRAMLTRVIENHPSFAHASHSSVLKNEAVNGFFKLTVRAGDEILSQGDAGDNFYVVSKGFCEGWIAKPADNSIPGSSDGNTSTTAVNRTYTSSFNSPVEQQGLIRQRIETFGAGQSFGEVALLYDSVRGASVIAKTDCELWCLDRTTFQRVSMSASAHLQRIFDRNASVNGPDGLKYMTAADFLKTICPTRTSGTSTDRLDPESQLMLRLLEARSGSQSVLVNFSEFVHFDLLLSRPNSDLEIAFRLIDLNKDGYIVKNELAHALEISGLQWDGFASDTQIMEMFGIDGTKTVSYADFMRFVNDHQVPKPVSDFITQVPAALRLLYSKWTGSQSDAPLVAAESELDRRKRKWSSFDTLLVASGSNWLARSLLYPLNSWKLLAQTQIASLPVFLRAYLARGLGLYSSRLLASLVVGLGLRQHVQAAFYQNRPMPFFQNFAISGSCAVLSNLLLYPLELWRTKSLVHGSSWTFAGTSHRSSLKAAFHGSGISMGFVFGYVGGQFSIFDALSARYSETSNASERQSGRILSAAAAGALAQAMFYPLDTIRHRMQADTCSFRAALQGRLYRGISIASLRSALVTIATVVVYDTLRERAYTH